MLVILLMCPVANRSEKNEVLRARHSDRLRASVWGYTWDAKVGLTKLNHTILNARQSLVVIVVVKYIFTLICLSD